MSEPILDTNYVWNQVLPLLEKSLNKPIYETLISSTKPLVLKDSKMVIAVPNEIIKEWLSKHCKTLIEKEASNLFSAIQSVEFTVGSKDLFTTPPIDRMGKPVYLEKPAAPERVVPGSIYLNPRYVFKTFVVGHGNRFAHAASLAVAESPAAAYNPLFLYGGVGLGKTHLMQAIGHYALLASPDVKVLYITSEMFTNELINSIRDDKAKEFRNKYRGIDILLVDDIQFLAGKEKTQEEFFHTFNALYEANKQIVVSSDRPPKEIPTLEERLRSRFEWGLIADMQPPDFETRIAILKKKAEISELNVSDEVLTHIASKISSNIRELEGALIRIVAFASLTGHEITPALTDEVLKDLVAPERRPAVTMGVIKKAAADYYSVRIDDMSAKIRTREIATARQVAMFLARELTDNSLPKIGEEFGGRDHTTVMHAVDKIKTAIHQNKDVAEAVKNIKEGLKKYAP